MLLLLTFAACTTEHQKSCDSLFERGYDEGFSLAVACEDELGLLLDTACFECPLPSQRRHHEERQECRAEGRSAGFEAGQAEVEC